jgi:hypothetical protein
MKLNTYSVILYFFKYFLFYFYICKNKKLIEFISKILNHKRLSFQPWKPLGLKVFFLTTYKYFNRIILFENFIFLLFKKFMTV